MKPRIVVIIPAFNEVGNIPLVVADIPRELVSEIVVVDNGSVDGTGEAAQIAGATVLREENRGYGFACLKGINYFLAKPKEDQPFAVVFLDGDYSDFPDQMRELIFPITENKFDFVLGSRVLGKREQGSLTPQQRFGNGLATTLIRWFYGMKYSDLGPFRAIRWDSLESLKMQDKTYGWTVEMQLKAAKKKLRILEIPVDYRKRATGKSKVSGTIGGSLKAGFKIIGWIFRYL